MLLDATYASYVNLDHRTDRRGHMEEQLPKAGIQAERTRGRLPSEYSGDPARVQVMQDRTPGAIGCWMSQVAVMEEALMRERHALVMEDDLVFCSDFPDRLAIIEDFCDTHPWDIIWLGGTFHREAEWHKDLGTDAECTDHPRMARTFGAFSTHAYLVNRESIQRLLKLLRHLQPYAMGIDWAMIQLQPQLFTYAFVPGCVKQYDNQSDIGNGMTVFSGFAKLGPHWFQDRMEEFLPVQDWLPERART